MNPEIKGINKTGSFRERSLILDEEGGPKYLDTFNQGSFLLEGIELLVSPHPHSIHVFNECSFMRYNI